jgi:hypothetical protein
LARCWNRRQPGHPVDERITPEARGRKLADDGRKGAADEPELDGGKPI